MKRDEKLIVILITVCCSVALLCYVVLIAPIQWKKYVFMLVIATGVVLIVGSLVEYFKDGS